MTLENHLRAMTLSASHVSGEESDTAHVPAFQCRLHSHEILITSLKTPGLRGISITEGEFRASCNAQRLENTKS